jgi:hypothetical protein
MAGLADIQAYDVTPILQQQRQDAILYAKEQSDMADLQAKQMQLQYQAKKDYEKQFGDIVSGYQKFATSEDIKPEIRKWAVEKGYPRIKSFLDKGDMIGAQNESAKVISEISTWDGFIDEQQTVAKQTAQSLAPFGVNAPVFESEYVMRRVFNEDGSIKTVDQIKNDTSDITNHILFNSANPALFTPGGKVLPNVGTKKQVIDITTDAGYSGAREKRELELPAFMVYDRVKDNLDIERGPDGLLHDKWFKPYIMDNPVQFAKYSRLARDKGAKTDEEILKQMKVLVAQDAVNESKTEFKKTYEEKKNDAAYMRMAGLIGSAEKNTKKYQGPNAIDAISGAMSQDINYVQAMGVEPGIKGYNGKLIDVTAQMPDKGFVFKREGGRTVTADKVYVDPDNKAVVIIHKGAKAPVVYKGTQVPTLLRQATDYNNIKDGHESVIRSFDDKGNFLLGTDPEGNSYISNEVSASRRRVVDEAKNAVDQFIQDDGADPSELYNLSKIISGRVIALKLKGEDKTTDEVIKEVKKGKDGTYVLVTEGGKEWNFTKDVKYFKDRLKRIKR